ncbi:MAG: UbiA prenyltransferase family protein [bacterium]|nr:UbiA prenyltransferase family protein [bacterium]
MATPLDLLELARPKHWAKNAFVFMPVPFALASGATFPPLPFALGLIGFCLANSAVYAFNDARDVEQDRRHPRNRTRPVASGRVSPLAAQLFSAVLLIVGGAAAAASGSRTALVILLAYAALNAAYSLGAKRVALLDVFLLSSGFVLRVLLGCALIDVVPSSWLLLCSSALALFLALTKRRADVARGLGSDERPSLGGYNQTFLDQAMTLTACLTLIAYALYSMEADVLIPGREFASLPFVVFGVLDYLRVAHLEDRGGSPVDLILSSPTLLICGLGWGVATLWSVRL